MRAFGLIVAIALLGGCATAGRSDGGAPSRSFAGTHWTIASLNGAPPAAARKTAITFDTDRISGNAGCNSFGGGYSVAGSVMTVTQVISTKMACMGAGMDQEDTFFKILATPMTIAWKDDGSVILSDDAGSVTLAPAS